MAASPQKWTILREFFDITKTGYNSCYKKAWCKACFEARVTAILASDREEVERGDRAEVRCMEDARSSAYLSTPGMPISTRLDRLVAHVASCTLIGPPDYRTKLVEGGLTEKVAAS